MDAVLATRCFYLARALTPSDITALPSPSYSPPTIVPFLPPLHSLLLVARTESVRHFRSLGDHAIAALPGCVIHLTPSFGIHDYASALCPLPDSFNTFSQSPCEQLCLYLKFDHSNSLACLMVGSLCIRAFMNSLQPFLNFHSLESERPSQSAHPRSSTSSLTRISNKGASDSLIMSQHEALSQ